MAMAADPIPDFIAWSEPRAWPTVAPAPAPMLPSCDRLRAGEAGGAIAAVGGRSDPRIADAQVEQDRGGHDRHTRHADVEADVVLLEPADDAGRGVEAEGAAAGEDDRVDFLDRVDR